MTGSHDREVLLVGSVPLADSETVFRVTGAVVGDHVQRIPDGETGLARSLWVQCQIPFFLGHPQLRMVEEDLQDARLLRTARIPSGGIYSRTSVGAYLGRAKLDLDNPDDELVFDNLGYADWALESYAIFTRLKAERAVPKQVRFQVCLPSPLFGDLISAVPGEASVISAAYQNGLFHEVERIASVVPHDELAIQWDCIEPAFFSVAPESGQRAMVERLTGLSGAVPADVELGYHLCFGDVQYRNGIELSLRTTVGIANAISAGSSREISWFHMPASKDWYDDEHFAPLADLVMSPTTVLFLGLVHLDDGKSGNRRRIEAAARVREQFGIATECGLGRRSVEEIPDLLALHVEVLGF